MGEDRTGRDQPTDRPTTGRRFTVSEAAGVLGISVEAVRGRIKRGTIGHERDDARVYVILDADRPTTGRDQGDDQSAGRPELVDLLRAQVEDLRADRDAWREQARRSDYLLGSAMERARELEGRLRELEAPADREARESLEDRNSDPTPREPPSSIGDVATPRSGVLASLIPLPAKYSWVGRDLVLRDEHHRQFSVAFGHLIAITLPIFAAAADVLMAQNLVEPRGFLTLRLVAAVVSGMYVGIKEGPNPEWPRVIRTGVQMGMFTTGVVCLVAWASGLPIISEYGFANTVTTLLITFGAGTFAVFFFATFLGVVIQVAAEQFRWGTDGSVAAREEGLSVQATAIIGLIGVLGGALVQSAGQIISALMSNGGG